MNQKHLHYLSYKPDVFDRWVRMGGIPNLRRQYISGPLFEANLYRARMQGATLDGATLDGADLTAVNLYGATIRGTTFRRASMNGVDLRHATIKDSSFGFADLTGAKVDGAVFARCNFYGAEVGLSGFTGATFTNCENIAIVGSVVAARWPSGLWISFAMWQGMIGEVTDEIDDQVCNDEDRDDLFKALKATVQHCQSLGWLS